MNDRNSPIASLNNLGPTSAKWLNAVGIQTKTDLIRVGPVVAYRMVRQAGFHETLNLLYAMHGAVTDTHWTKVAADIKKRLRSEVENGEFD